MDKLLDFLIAIISVFLGTALIFLYDALKAKRTLKEGGEYGGTDRIPPDVKVKRDYEIALKLFLGCAVIAVVTTLITLLAINTTPLPSLQTYHIVVAITAFAVTIALGLLALVGQQKWKNAHNSPAYRKKGYQQFIICVVLFIVMLFLFTLILFMVNPPKPVVPMSNSSLEPTSSPMYSSEDIDSTHGFYRDYPLPEGLYSGWLKLENMQPDTMLPNGKVNDGGTLKYQNGDIYTGDWINGAQTGNGTKWYKNGDIYVGEWKNGQRHGEDGAYTWSDGRKYVGAYKDNLRDGIGKFTGWKDKTNGWIGTYKGMSIGDKFEGEGEFWFDNGDYFKGVYKDDVRWSGAYYREGEDELAYHIENGKIIS